MKIYLLGIDIGTTHCKAGIFDQQGRLIQVASRPSQSQKSANGLFYYDPQALWDNVVAVIREVIQQILALHISGVGIASMAETGMLVDRLSGAPRTDMIPWFDSTAKPQAENLRKSDDIIERFCRTGIRANFQCGLAKILWLRDQETSLLDGATWLIAADTVAYRLTGVMATDYSLAGQTYTFRIDQKSWDAPWLRTLGVDPDIFPQALPSGKTLRRIQPQAAQATGLLTGTYFPYLAGSGSPHIDLRVRAAFIGLDTTHTRAELAQGVLEGAAYEIEFIRQVAEELIDAPMEQIIVSGEGTRNPHWIQIKADISGCRLEALDMSEATLLGAALIAGVGCGIYPDAQTASATEDRSARTVYLPDPTRHQAYTHYYENGFLALQASLRTTAQVLARKEN